MPKIYTCAGIRTPEAVYYATEHVLSGSRGTFGSSQLKRVERALFPYKDWEPRDGVTPYSRQEFLDRSGGVELPVFPENAKRNKRRLKKTQDESAYLQAVCYLCRVWTVEAGRIFARDCRLQCDTLDGYCEGTDEKKCSGSIGYTTAYAPKEEGIKVGGHVIGTTLPWDDTYAKTPGDVHRITKRAREEDKVSYTVRATMAWISLRGVPPFLLALEVVAGTDKADAVAKHWTTLRRMARAADLNIYSMGSDAASVEISAKRLTIGSSSIPRDADAWYDFHLSKYGIAVCVPVFDQRQPLLAISDPLHAVKTLRNFLVEGGKYSVIGKSTINFSKMDLLLVHPATALLTSDLHNADKQSDDSAYRFFCAPTLETMYHSEEDRMHQGFEAMFVLNFNFGT
ncbi:hypothetical protein QFC24_006796 [Naganishia onofrii]|uniref:Uncharacterized protein n=1 Tax=Naganishia onofrii TaxID=1851511 RepID=A0ACC2WYI8_9TREE|nr:hypothetical protein QFC24_006796 [Naganishia onofrii]